MPAPRSRRSSSSTGSIATRCCGLLRRRLGRRRAEDAFQETFLRALAAYGRLSTASTSRAWVLTIAGNVAIDTLRRRRPTAEPAGRPHEDARPAYEELGELTDGLPPKERAAVVLRYGYDLTYDQIAAALGSNPVAARQAASTGVRRLRARRDTMTVPADLDRRFREAAVRAGLLDAGYDVVESPVGPLLVAATDRGILRISFDADPEQRARPARPDRGPPRSPRAARRRPRPPRARRVLRPAPPGLRSPCRPARHDRVHHAGAGELARIPYGHTATYGELAARVGRPRAARAIGMIMNHNPIPIVLPCHRIIGANGSLVGYGGGLDRKEQLLRLEGALLV